MYQWCVGVLPYFLISSFPQTCEGETSKDKNNIQIIFFRQKMPVIQINTFLLLFTIFACHCVLGQSSLRCASISECPLLLKVPEEKLKDYQRCDEGQVRQNLILENLPFWRQGHKTETI